jgi:hypothetical protein
MGMSFDDMNNRLTINRNPIQRPGVDPCLRQTVFGGPDASRDVRLYLDTASLKHMLEISSKSSLDMAVINMAGLEISVYQSGSGHTYEVWKIIGLAPQPLNFSLE